MAEAERITLDEDDIATTASQRFRASEEHTSLWRQEAHTWYDMEAGEQWESEDLARLEEQERPAVTIDRILRTINAIVGTQISNRQETQFLPRDIGDVQVNEILSAGSEWVRDQCDAEDEESDAFRDMAICGMGWTETRMDYLANPDGDVVIERIDPLEMYWDTAAKKRNLADGKWFMHVRDIPIDEFESRWPDVDVDSITALDEPAPDDTTTRTHVYPQDAYKNQQAMGSRRDRKTIRVKHYQWCEYEAAYRVGPGAERVSRADFDKLKPRLDKAGAKYIQQRVAVWKRAFVAGSMVLQQGPCPFPDGPTLRCMTYMRDRNRRTWFGLVKSMVDPQRFGNKFFSQILDILNKGAKGGILMESDAVDDIRNVEEKWARSDSVIVLKPGGKEKIMPKPVVQLPPGLDKLMEFSLNSVHEVTGVNLELLGLANREQPGVLEHQRKQAGITIIAPLFDAIRRYRKNQGKVLLYFIQKYISDGRLIRIVGKNGQEQYVPLAKDTETREYDVIVDESPTSPNMKERVFAALTQLLPALEKAGVPLPPELLDYAPIPSVLAQKWKELIEQSPKVPPALQKRMEEMTKQIQQLTEENKNLKDKKQETTAELFLKKQEQDAEALMAGEEANRKRRETQEEISLARWKAEQEIAIQRQKAKAEILISASRPQPGANGENGEGGGKGVDMKALSKILSDDQPRRRRVHIERDANGFISTAMIEDVLDGEMQGNA